MGAKRKGTLELRERNGVKLWHARVTVGTKPHTRRLWYCLETGDHAIATRRLADLVVQIAKDPKLQAPPPIASGVLTVREYAGAWLAKREAQGVGMVHKERQNLEASAFPTIGDLGLRDVRPSHVRQILDAALTRGLKRNTIGHIRAVLHRLFFAALEGEHVAVNPVAAVRTPKTREVRKDRAILSDDEIARFMACPGVDLELRMVSIVARCEGGMRTGDLHKWDWAMIDREHFAGGFIPRSKTGKPQPLAIPAVLTPHLRAWWQKAGEPTHGPVFPSRRGARAGQAKGAENSYAKRLRRGLWRAGVVRLATVEIPATQARKLGLSLLGPGSRTDKSDPLTRAPNPSDPIYFETASTLPVDFHSFRRAFVSALAESGTNIQHAMHLSAHADPKVHMRYAMNTAAMQQIPAAALPLSFAIAGLESSELAVSATALDDSAPDDRAKYLCRGRESNPRPGAYETPALAN